MTAKNDIVQPSDDIHNEIIEIERAQAEAWDIAVDTGRVAPRVSPVLVPPGSTVDSEGEPIAANCTPSQYVGYFGNSHQGFIAYRVVKMIDSHVEGGHRIYDVEVDEQEIVTIDEKLALRLFGTKFYRMSPAFPTDSSVEITVTLGQGEDLEHIDLVVWDAVINQTQRGGRISYHSPWWEPVYKVGLQHGHFMTYVTESELLEVANSICEGRVYHSFGRGYLIFWLKLCGIQRSVPIATMNRVLFPDLAWVMNYTYAFTPADIDKNDLYPGNVILTSINGRETPLVVIARRMKDVHEVRLWAYGETTGWRDSDKLLSLLKKRG